MDYYIRLCRETLLKEERLILATLFRQLLAGRYAYNYFENPPLMIWVQSFVFKILGDHWWTEKLFLCSYSHGQYLDF
ncbi:MAG: hypothetical protein IPJ13_15725 [Saprospiraceae bacterium]|nr:hypothetical protein [Saprospiraceae bacterium]